MARDADYEDEDEYERSSRSRTRTEDPPPRRRSRDDGEEEEEPRSRSRSRSRDDDDQDQAPRSRSRSRSRDDDDEDEAPRRSRSSSRDDEDDEAPRSRSRSRSRDDEDDEPRSRSRSRSRDDDDDEEPRSRSRSRSRDDDDDEDDRPRGRSRSRDDDDDDRSSRGRSNGRSTGKVKKAGPGSWEQGKRLNETSSSFAQRLKPNEEEQVIKFLEDAPYVSYRQHWINELKGQKSFVCLEGFDDKGCPLCDIAGDRPAVRHAFNVALLGAGLDPVLKSFEVGVQLFETLRNHHNGDRTGPLTRHFWAVKLPKKGNTQISMVKERDLEPDWDILEQDRDTRGIKKLYTSEILDIPTRKQLREIAEDLES